MNVDFERKTVSEGGKDEWLTPPYIIEALGSFDLDPCSPIKRPFETAKNYYTELDNGLMQNWVGRVWCNPPYGNEIHYWLEKCVMHGNAIVLIFSRTDTNTFHRCVFNTASAVLFLKGRLSFYHASGLKGGTAGAASVLVAYGKENTEILKNSGLKGKYIEL